MDNIRWNYLVTRLSINIIIYYLYLYFFPFIYCLINFVYLMKPSIAVETALTWIFEDDLSCGHHVTASFFTGRGSNHQNIITWALLLQRLIHACHIIQQFQNWRKCMCEISMIVVYMKSYFMVRRWTGVLTLALK